jgi:uncharacterized protein with FMN-binding domain
MEPQYNNQMAGLPSDQTYQRKNRLIIIIVAITLAIGLIAIIASVVRSLGAGTLDATASSAKAKILVQGPDGKTNTIGTGHATAKLKPGDYRVTADDNGAQASLTVTIQKGKTTKAKLDIQKGVPIQRVANYSARSLYVAADSSLFIVNDKDNLLYHFFIGDSEAKPYLTNYNPVVRTYWSSPTQFIFKKNDDSLTLVNNGQTSTLNFAGNPAVTDSLSFDPTGGYAFITSSNDIAVAAGIGQPLRKIGIANTTDSTTSIAPDGSVLIATPSSGNGQVNPSRLYKNGTSVELPKDLNSLSDAAWAPDSSKFAYAATNGNLYTYDLATKTSTQFSASKLSEPQTVAWVSPQVLIFADNSAIWRYQLGAPAATKLADIEGIINTPLTFHFSSDRQLVYFSTTPNDDGKGGAIYAFAPNYNELSADLQKSLLDSQKPVTATETAYDGLDDLTAVGVNSDQLTNFKFALSRFGRTNHLNLDTASVSAVVAAPHDRFSASTTNSYTFNLSVNHNRIFTAKLDTLDLYSIHLFLSENGQSVFDSGVINTIQ